MRKYFILIITIAMLLLTTIAYIYENSNIHVPEIEKPSFNISSSKFGEIKNIVWLDNSVAPYNALIILSSRINDGIAYSYLYYLNLDINKSILLSEFPSHKNLDDVILFDNTFSSDDIVTAYDKGIVRTEIEWNRDSEMAGEGHPKMIEIDGFEDANSMDFKGSLFFSRTDDKLIHFKQLYIDFFSSAMGSKKSSDIIKYYRKPYYIVNANSLNKILTYASVKKNGVNLYAMEFNGMPISKLNKPFIKNVIMAKGIEDGYGLIGMKASDNSTDGKSLDILMKRRKFKEGEDSYTMDTIPFNTDMFGSIPDMDSITFNEYYTLAYTLFDENHRGKIKISSYNDKPKVIVDDENIFSPIRITEKKIKDERVKIILYFTYENNDVRVKLCDIDGKLIKDITDMVM